MQIIHIAATTSPNKKISDINAIENKFSCTEIRPKLVAVFKGKKVGYNLISFNFNKIYSIGVPRVKTRLFLSFYNKLHKFTLFLVPGQKTLKKIDLPNWGNFETKEWLSYFITFAIGIKLI